MSSNRYKGEATGGKRRVTVALAGNPNVGKSTLFNALTGMRQHTGNWPGKTVGSARGRCETDQFEYTLVDIPGTYSLMARSKEEEVARDFLCFERPDAAAVVCDATCLERNLDLVMQVLEICPKTLVCVNLLDEARRKGVRVDLELLSERLGVPVVGTEASSGKGLDAFLAALDGLLSGEEPKPHQIDYPDAVEAAVCMVQPAVHMKNRTDLSSRWISLRLLGGDGAFVRAVSEKTGVDAEDETTALALRQARLYLSDRGIDSERFEDMLAAAAVRAAERAASGAVTGGEKKYGGRDGRLDRILTGRKTAYPVMLALLCLVLWITVSGANYPSELLSKALMSLQDVLLRLLSAAGVPELVKNALVSGVYRVLAWVVSVMLPPMAIFFPLFTILEDLGYLPRVAYDLDRPFQRCGACGKQALTMCMGLGCNAVGVTGCRIIDSPRERLLAVLKNAFMPCNGRFPALITMAALLIGGTAATLFGGLVSAAAITAAIAVGAAATFGATKLLSSTLLRGETSSFTLELPPYRVPKVGRVIVRSVLDRTVFVLGRAAAVAAPAGLVIWIMANISLPGGSLLSICAGALDPVGRLMGMDGVILMAFILGFPANEIVVPLIVMGYLGGGTLAQTPALSELHTVFAANGWTWATAVSVMLFTVMHWPCSTTLLTVKKETGSLKWTAAAAVVPTAAGAVCCILFTLAVQLFSRG